MFFYVFADTMPRTKWEEDSMRYVFCFFPLIGLVIGILETGWFWIARQLEISSLLYVSVAVVLPILVTGGIHLDGYMDTCDALFSYGDREKKLEIMKDSHTGAFAVIYCGVYLLLSAGFLFRAVSVGIMDSHCGRGNRLFAQQDNMRISNGLVALRQKFRIGSYVPKQQADRKTAKIALTIWFMGLICILGCLSLKAALFAIPLLGLGIIVFVSMIKKQFGGITGDLAGFLLEICELLLLLAAII